MTVNREANHPMKPYRYHEPSVIWSHFGYQLEKDVTIHISWTQTDTEKEELNALSVWTKAL